MNDRIVTDIRRITLEQMTVYMVAIKIMYVIVKRLQTSFTSEQLLSFMESLVVFFSLMMAENPQMTQDLTLLT